MTTTTVQPPAAPKRKRGRENVRDMLLSLAACMAVVIPVWYFGQPSEDQTRGIRVVDTAPDVAAFSQAAPGLPVPGPLPEGWRPTSSTLEGDRYRIGFITPDDGYVEYLAQAGETEEFVSEVTGKGSPGSPLRVGDRAFRIWTDDDGHTSLVLTSPAGSVVLGGLREAAEDEEITELAGLLQG